jgi:hypothetical protein
VPESVSPVIQKTILREDHHTQLAEMTKRCFFVANDYQGETPHYEGYEQIYSPEFRSKHCSYYDGAATQHACAVGQGSA